MKKFLDSHWRSLKGAQIVIFSKMVSIRLGMTLKEYTDHFESLNLMFLCWGESDLSIAFSTHPGNQASSRGEAKDTALLSSRDGYILQLTVWPKMRQASCGVWRWRSGRGRCGLGRPFIFF